MTATLKAMQGATIVAARPVYVDSGRHWAVSQSQEDFPFIELVLRDQITGEQQLFRIGTFLNSMTVRRVDRAEAEDIEMSTNATPENTVNTEPKTPIQNDVSKVEEERVETSAVVQQRSPLKRPHDSEELLDPSASPKRIRFAEADTQLASTVLFQSPQGIDSAQKREASDKREAIVLVDSDDDVDDKAIVQQQQTTNSHLKSKRGRRNIEIIEMRESRNNSNDDGEEDDDHNAREEIGEAEEEEDDEDGDRASSTAKRLRKQLSTPPLPQIAVAARNAMIARLRQEQQQKKK